MWDYAISCRRTVPVTSAGDSWWLLAPRDHFTAQCVARLPLMADSKGAKAVSQMQHDDAVGYADAQEKKSCRWGKRSAAA